MPPPIIPQPHRPKIGLALGSGAARGLAHIGVIRELNKFGLSPDIICGSSIGAFMGAAHILGRLDDVQEWLAGMSTYELVRQMDIKLLASSGLADGENMLRFVIDEFGNPNIEDLDLPYAAIATDMKTGREIWLQEGPVWNAARASMALPGMLTPINSNGRWLLDGGLVNPVPVSVCKALGADIIIAVNLNGDLVSRDQVLIRDDSVSEEVYSAEQQAGDTQPNSGLPDTVAAASEDQISFFEKLSASIRERTTPLVEQWMSPSEDAPGLFNVVSSSINIMQDRITRSRLAGEPADLILTPRLSHIGMLEVTRAEEIVAEGEACVQRMNAVIEHRLGLRSSAQTSV